MGLFGKDRTGTFKATDGTGRHFTWTIRQFASHDAGTTLDSENVSCFTKVKFHLHMSLGTNGDIGLYVHYKKPPIPKYSYYFENTKGEIMRQHTAHTIPDDSERCGHWNVCSREDMRGFLGEEDTLFVRFVFDDDTLVVKRVADKNMTSVMWTIPNVETQNLNPYSSRGFFIDNVLLVARLDSKRETSTVMATAKHDDISSYILFLFCRKGKIPPHSIEFVDASGVSYHRVEKNEDGSVLTVLVDRQVVQQHTANEGILFVKINFYTGGNPLEALNALSGLAGGDGAEKGSSASGGGRTVELGEKKELYNVMDD
ncbi:hypothetical protein NESM_000531200 [Novymonas esmeraldas]|uniref:Uncharacterized protein n=1 Tax=Novymonas esmeraldas TaxID=1808958 RepID=A0AAW0ERI9_9TRYP